MSDLWSKGAIQVKTHPLPIRRLGENVTGLDVLDTTKAVKPPSKGFGGVTADLMPYKLYGITTRNRRLLLMESNDLPTIERTALEISQQKAPL